MAAYSGSAVDEESLPYGRQHLDEEDLRAVLEVLRGPWLTQGPMGERFEAALCEQIGSRHAVVTSSGTSALHLAALCLGWSPGDVVIVPAITFLASANCAAYVGAEPYFVDIDEETLCIDVDEVERAIRRLRGEGRSVRAVVGVDMAGHPCDWPALRAVASEHGVQLVDDACHALGARYGGDHRVGSCSHSDVSILSFHPVKHITTGEGGAILTNDPRIAERAQRLRSHGIVRGPEAVAGWEGPWHYDMTDLGYNYRLSDIQSSLGLSQLGKLREFVDRRRELASLYAELLATTPEIRTPTEGSGIHHAYHLYVVRIDFQKLGLSRRDFFGYCQDHGVKPQVHYRPVPLNSYYSKRPINADVVDRIPVAMRYYSQALSVPMYPRLTESQVERVVETLKGGLRDVH